MNTKPQAPLFPVIEYTQDGPIIVAWTILQPVMLKSERRIIDWDSEGEQNVAHT